MAEILADRAARSERRRHAVVPWRHLVERGTDDMALTIAAQKPIHQTHALVEDGAVDADGHILEPPTLWEEYIDPQFRDRALRFRLSEPALVDVAL